MLPFAGKPRSFGFVLTVGAVLAREEVTSISLKNTNPGTR
ncbi:hypothetical protein OU5_0601 [Pseudomonas mandelii JR-1]|uniref:Uncharacterized protein n=1 Tax=Pseudomonas mandelii JR-1 TaxID=1147786 RepID=A0A024E528_9PSED|nr:hypothetical protein OU5_0601 [Pseudomonas mandelii JR-1]